MSQLGKVFQLIDAFHHSSLLFNALETKLLEFLAENRSLEEICQKFGWLPRKTMIFLKALEAIGLVEQDTPGLFRVSDLSQTYLLRHSPQYVGAVADHQRHQWNLWQDFSAILASSEVLPIQQNVSLFENEDKNRSFQQAMIQLSTDNLNAVINLEIFEKARLVYDICGGHGRYLCEVQKKHRQVRGSVIDLGYSRAYCEEMIDAYSASDKLSFKERDVARSSLLNLEPADVIMFNDCFHYFDEATVARLINESSSRLNSGGSILILTQSLNDDLASPQGAAMFSFHMMLNVQHGGLHARSNLMKMMESSALEVEAIPVGELQRYVILLGKKRGNT